MKEMFRMILGMPRIHKKIKQLHEHGYQVDSFVSLIQNSNDTDTIVYTSRQFQPMAETFSEKFTFVGPTVKTSPAYNEQARKVIYISLGTVLNQNKDFYQNCIKAFAGSDYEIVMSIGEKTDMASLGQIPENFTVENSVNQLSVLQRADLFITHSGMNSVNESLYFGVPMILYPFHSEQKLIAERVAELGAGMRLKGHKARELKEAVDRISRDASYFENAQELAVDFQRLGGAVEAADVVLGKIAESS
ncbi:nucleotide disphospho-sugar-binding domain-containing protein [Gracilibacillus oryzae]|uniref:nucleotide disphospho-sugar-binding domain-containing protein n=1 Tax=Gracilibacillus oryzae TaxID=1672701 RepID=UPI002B1BCEC9|nr:nucleotide disphospho-sugar-binding domain-containing protein [Gracilibacillus oryzae]